jgi:hypothetical protein
VYEKKSLSRVSRRASPHPAHPEKPGMLLRAHGRRLDSAREQAPSNFKGSPIIRAAYTRCFSALYTVSENDRINCTAVCRLSIFRVFIKRIIQAKSGEIWLMHSIFVASVIQIYIPFVPCVLPFLILLSIIIVIHLACGPNINFNISFA